MFETLAAVRIATGARGPGPGPHHLRWLREARPRLRALDLRPITVLQPRRGYTPDFLSPPPLTPSSDFEAELTRVAATPAPVVRQEIEMSLLESPGAQTSELGRLLTGDPAEVLGFLTQLLRAAWHALVEPAWPRVRATLEADIAYRSRRLAEGGLDNLFADLDQSLRWTGRTLVRDRGGNEHLDLAGRGVLLMPSAFKWDEPVVITQPPWQPTVAYRARGLGDLWQPAQAAPGPALERLIGRTRATLLTGLSEPGIDHVALTTARAGRGHGLRAPQGAARGRSGSRGTAPPRDPVPAHAPRLGADPRQRVGNGYSVWCTSARW